MYQNKSILIILLTIIKYLFRIGTMGICLKMLSCGVKSQRWFGRQIIVWHIKTKNFSLFCHQSEKKIDNDNVFGFENNLKILQKVYS